jgi:hypothetical protein
MAIAALLLASLADVVTTRVGLLSGRVIEWNPLMVWWTRTTARAVLAKTLGLALAVWQVTVIAQTHPTVAVLVTWACALATAMLAYTNFQLARRADQEDRCSRDDSSSPCPSA